MADTTPVARYRGDGPDALAAAIAALLRHARDSDYDYTFGPLRLADLERDGLSVEGPDLGHAMTVLAAVPGLALVTY